MLGSTSLAGLPSALFTTRFALAALAVGRISQARGRRPGLAIGHLTGAIGSASVTTAAVLDNPVLLFIALFFYGAGTATNLQARYVGADLAAPGHSARAVFTVLVSTTLGGVAGPNLAAPNGSLVDTLGIPHLTSLFRLSGLAYALASLVLALWLRPAPLLLAATSPRPRRARPSSGRPAPRTTRTCGVDAEGRCSARCSWPSPSSSVVIAIHIGAMYLLSPLTGWLVDRYSRMNIAAASGSTLLAAGLLAAAAPGGSVALLAPDETAKVWTEITVAGDATRGEHYGVLWAEVSPDHDPTKQVRNVARAGVRLYLSIGPDGEPPSDFRIEDLTGARTADGIPVVTARVENTGGRALDLAGKLTLSNGPGGLSAGPFNVRADTLGPGGSTLARTTLHRRLPDGVWTARLTLASGLVKRETNGRISIGSPPKRGENPRMAVLTIGILVSLAMAGLLTYAYRARHRSH